MGTGERWGHGTVEGVGWRQGTGRGAGRLGTAQGAVEDGERGSWGQGVGRVGKKHMNREGRWVLRAEEEIWRGGGGEGVDGVCALGDGVKKERVGTGRRR